MGCAGIPGSFFEVQPDRTRVELQVRGDEHFNWTEGLSGYTVISHKGWFECAKLNRQGNQVVYREALLLEQLDDDLQSQRLYLLERLQELAPPPSG